MCNACQSLQVMTVSVQPSLFQFCMVYATSKMLPSFDNAATMQFQKSSLLIIRMHNNGSTNCDQKLVQLSMTNNLFHL